MKKYIFALLPLLLLSSCNNNEEKEPEVKQYKVVTIQAFNADAVGVSDTTEGLELPEGVNNDSELITKSAEYLANKLTNVTYSKENKHVGPLTKEIFQSLGPNQIISFQGHGLFDSTYHSLIQNENDYDFEDTTNEDYNEHRIVEGSMKESFSYKYIDKYCGDLSGSIIYLGQCYSCYDSRLAQSFLAKGAKAIFGNSNYVKARYGDLMQYTIIKALADTNPETGKLNNVSQALDVANTLIGRNQLDFYTFAGMEEGHIVLYGDSFYSL